LADPGGTPLPGSFRLSAATELLRLADAQGVLPTVLARLPEAVRGAATQAWRATLEAAAAQTLVLRQVALRLTGLLDAAGIDALVVKGPSFADRLYPASCWRPFTDLDLLLQRRDLPAAAAVMRAAGFRPEGLALKHAPDAYGEEKWVADQGGLEVLVELHWDLIGSPTLRRGRRCDLALLQSEGGARTPAALLLVAAVHAAYGHAFDRLQPLVDVLQATRGAAGPPDIGWLSRRAAEGRLGPGLALALDLAARAFAAPECEALRRRLGLRRPPFAVRWLMTPGVVVATAAKRPGLQSWRRQFIRPWLKLAGR